MPDEMKSATAIAARAGDVHGVRNQQIEMVVHGIDAIRPGAGGIAALARRDGAIARGRERGELAAPHVEGFCEAVQQQHERRVLGPIAPRIENESRSGLDLPQLSHEVIPSCTEPALPSRSPSR
jgi:hypothetical protein